MMRLNLDGWLNKIKANVDLKNLTEGLKNTICTTQAGTTSTASNEVPAVVVKNYRNGKSWYRVFSDGWVEQGGYRTGSENTFVTFNLLKSFATTDYSVKGNCTRTDTAFDPSFIVNNNSKTTTSFSALPNSSSQGVYWTACGY